MYGPTTAKQKSTIKERCKGLNIGLVWHKEEDEAQAAQTSTAPRAQQSQANCGFTFSGADSKGREFRGLAYGEACA